MKGNTKTHLNKKFALLSFKFANLSTTELLKLEDFLTSLFSIDNMARALSLSSDIVFLKNVFTLLSVEKHLSASHDDIGVVINNFSSLTTSENVSVRLLSWSN